MAAGNSSTDRWTKRRRLLSQISTHLNEIENIDRDISDNALCTKLPINTQSHLGVPNRQDRIDRLEPEDNDMIEPEDNDINKLPCTLHQDVVDGHTHNEESGRMSSDTDSDPSDTDCHTFEHQTEQGRLEDHLAEWAIQYDISHAALAGLLGILRRNDSDLPKDPRALLGTVRDVKVKSLAGGQYYHFGLRKSILAVLEQFQIEDEVIKLQLNFDGLPLFKSSSLQFWHILGLVANCKTREPFVIGLFCGNSKPSSLNEYLKEFIEETRELEVNGFSHQAVRHFVKIAAVMCDTPARAFIKAVKGHGGYSGCDKCTQPGVYENGRMTFPETNAPLRSDKSFYEQIDKTHHQGTSPLSELDIGMVSSFPLDYMHLVCLGVVRKLMNLWVKGPLKTRLGPRDIKQISDTMQSLKPQIPKEFARKPRPLAEIDRWKAVEFREFLLYTGPVSLYRVLPETIYNNFMLLHVGVYILLSPLLCEPYGGYANDVLNLFVQHFGDLYGKHFISYNVHGLVHLAHEVQLYGPLDNISAFVFENFLGKLKRKIRKSQCPLSQIVKRFSEGKKTYSEEKNDALQREHQEGPTLINLGYCRQFKVFMSTANCSFTTAGADSCASIGNHIGLIQNFLSREVDGKQFVVYKRFVEMEPMYTYPLDSTILGIYKLSRVSDRLLYAGIHELKNKFCLFTEAVGNTKTYMAIPLLHT